MTQEEVKILEVNINAPFKSGMSIWIKAFAEYTTKTGEKLSMGCSPCYMKVLTYLKNNE